MMGHIGWQKSTSPNRGKLRSLIVSQPMRKALTAARVATGSGLSKKRSSKTFKLGPVDGEGGVEGVGETMAGRTSIQVLTNLIRCITLMITTCENQ
jgi:hypothetical protein